MDQNDEAVPGRDELFWFAAAFRPTGSGAFQIALHFSLPVICTAARKVFGLGLFNLRIQILDSGGAVATVEGSIGVFQKLDGVVVLGAIHGRFFLGLAVSDAG